MLATSAIRTCSSLQNTAPQRSPTQFSWKTKPTSTRPGGRHILRVDYREDARQVKELAHRLLLRRPDEPEQKNRSPTSQDENTIVPPRAARAPDGRGHDRHHDQQVSGRRSRFGDTRRFMIPKAHTPEHVTVLSLRRQQKITQSPTY